MIGKLLCLIGHHKWEPVGGRYLPRSGFSLALAEECIRCKKREHLLIAPFKKDKKITPQEFLRMINQ